MSTYLDYAVRTVDVSVFRSPGGAEDGVLSMDLFGDDGGQVCAGIQKLAQRWVLEFCTDIGSMPYAKTRGSEFMEAARDGLLATELDVYQRFNLDGENIRRGLVNEETDDDPDDERFAGAELTAVVLGGGYLSLQVELTSRAGSARAVVLPIPLAV